MALYAILAILFALVHLLIKVRRVGLVNPDVIFVIFQLLMCLGTFYLVDADERVDVRYALILLVFFGTYVISSLFAGMIFRTGGASVRLQTEVRLSRPTPGPAAWLAISVLVSVAYFYFVGYNTFLIGITSVLSGDDAEVDIATLRLESYAGTRYLFPGYVNQFKNILVPCLSVVIIHWCYSKRLPYRNMIATILGAVAALLVLGTGQRGAFVVASLIVACYVLVATRIKLPSAIIGSIVLALPLLLVSTLSNQRSSSESTGWGGQLGSALSQLSARVFLDNQESGIRAFRYIDSLATQHGAEWGRSLIGLLPGVSGSTLSSEVFALIYGSDRGTSPPSLVGSVYHNFGLIGVIVGAALLSASFCGLGAFMAARSEITTVGMVGIAGVSVICGSWIAGGPDYLLNSGLVPCMIMMLIGSKSRNSIISSMGASIPAQPLKSLPG